MIIICRAQRYEVFRALPNYLGDFSLSVGLHTHHQPALFEFDGELFHTNLTVDCMKDHLAGGTAPSHGQG